MRLRIRQLFRFESQLGQRDRFRQCFKPRVEWLEQRLAPTVIYSPPGDQTGTEGQASIFHLGAFTDTRSNGNPWKIDVDWGDGSAHTDFFTNTQVTIPDQPHAYGEEQATPYTATVTVTDNAGDSGSGTFQVTVNDISVVPAGVNFTAGVNVPFTNQAVATFTDPGGPEPNNSDPIGMISDHYSATIDWGDLTTSAGTITLSGNTFTVSGSHTYSQTGTFTTTTTIGHENTFPVQTTGTATVGVLALVVTSPGDQMATEGSPNTFPLGSFTDSTANANSWRVDVNWGDGSAHAMFTINAQGSLGSLPHTYGEEGTYLVTVRVTDNANVSGSTSFQAIISDPSVVATALNFSAGVNVALNNQAVATFTDPGGPEPNASDPIAGINNHYNAMIDWGDGNTTAGTITLNGNTFTVSGSHTYMQTGMFTTNITINHEGSTQVMVQGTANVTIQTVLVTAAANQPATEGASASLNLGSFSDSNSAATSWTVVVSWGDGSQTMFTTTRPGSLGTASHTFGEEGTYTVTVTVTNNVSSSGSATFQVSVSDPAVVATATTFSAVTNTALNNQTVATYTDPGGPEPNNSDPIGTISNHYAATINWGDGTTSTGTITFSNGVFTVSGNHTYTVSGTLQTTVTIVHENAPLTTVNGTANVSTTTTGLINFVDFETGDFSQTASHVGGAIVTSPALDGKFSLQLLRNNSVANVEIRASGTTYYNVATAFYSFLFQFASQTGEGGVVNFQDTSSHYKAAIHLSAAGKLLFYDINGNLLATGTTTLNPNQTYTIAAKIGTGTSAAWEVRINGNVEMSGTGNLGTTNNGSVKLGGDGRYTTNYYYDDVAISSQGFPQGIVVTSGGNQPATEGASASFNLGSFSDSNSAATSWTVVVSWGDGSQTMFTTTPGSLGTASHAFGEEGTYTVTVTVTDNASGSGSATFQVSVSDPAVVATATNFTETPGTPLVNQTVATYNDPGGAEPNPSDPGGTISNHYNATIDWGDGTTTTGSITQSNGVFTVSGNHTYSQAGPFQTKVTINHENATPVTVMGLVNSPQGIVVTSGGNQPATEGASASFNLGSFSDSNSAATSWTVVVSWGDGSQTMFTTTPGSLGTASHTFGEEGTYTVTVTVTDNASGSGSATFQVGVADPAVVATATNFTEVPGSPLVNQTVATFADPGGAEPNSSDPSGTINNHYTATIDWGDGTTTTGTITLSGNTFTVSGNHTYSQAGPFQTKVTINQENATPVTVMGLVNTTMMPSLGLVNYVNFETGDFSQGATHTDGAIVTSPALDGTFSLQLLRSGSVANFEIRQGGANYYNLPTAFYSFLFQFASQSGEGSVVNFQDTSSRYKAAIHLSASGKLLFFDINGNLLATGTTTLNPNQTYTIAAKIGTGTSAAWEIRINGNVEMSGTGNLGTTNNGSIELGGNRNYTTNYYYDDVAIDSAGYPLVAGLVNFVNLETGDFSQGATHTNGAIVTSPALDGTFSLQLLRSGSVANFEVRQGGANYYNLPTAFYSFLFQFASQSGEGGVVNFQDTSSHYKAAIHLSASGKLLFFDINGNLLATGTTTLNPNQTYTIAAKIGTGTSAAWEIRINGNVEMSGTGNLGTTNNGSIELGGNATYTTNYYYDDIAINSQGYPQLGGGAAAAAAGSSAPLLVSPPQADTIGSATAGMFDSTAAGSTETQMLPTVLLEQPVSLRPTEADAGAMLLSAVMHGQMDPTALIDSLFADRNGDLA